MLPELIDDVVPAKNVRSDHLECLHKSFEPLNALEDGLAEKVSRFVCEGAHPEIPLWLANNPAVNADHLYRPGRNNYSLHARHFSDAQLFERAEKAVAFRNEFYSLAGTVAKAELAEGDPRSIHVLIRLGQVLQATGA